MSADVLILDFFSSLISLHRHQLQKSSMGQAPEAKYVKIFNELNSAWNLKWANFHIFLRIITVSNRVNNQDYNRQ